MNKRITIMFITMSLITVMASACATTNGGVMNSQSVSSGIMSAQPNGAVISDKNNHRTAASLAYNAGSHGNAVADAKGMKATATAANTGSHGTARATSEDPFKKAVYNVQNNGTNITAEDRTLASVAKKGGVDIAERETLDSAMAKGGTTSAVAINETNDGRVSTVADRIFDLSKLGGMRMRVVEKKGWETNLNENLHPHAAPILSSVEGGPSFIGHKDIEFMKLAPGTILFECTPAKNNFIYGLFAVRSLGPFAYNLMQNFALRSFVKGRTQDGAWVIGAYFYLSDRLVETDSPIVVAESPWQTKKERIKRQVSEYEKIMGRVSDPGAPACPKMEKTSPARGDTGERVKTIIDQR